jgi:hypothetical protein
VRGLSRYVTAVIIREAALAFLNRKLPGVPFFTAIPVPRYHCRLAVAE